MKRNIVIYVLAICLALWSCEEQDNTYKGPLVVEFAKSSVGGTSLYLVTEGGQVFADSALIQLVGRPQDSPINVSWEIDEANTTALAGVHYNMISGNTIQIPAGSNFGSIEFEALGDGFSGPEEVVQIAFNLVSSDVMLSANYTSLIQELSITCLSDIEEGDWLETNFGELVTLVSLDEGLYEFSNFNINYYDPGFNPIRGIFRDVCNTLTLEGATEFGVQWRGEGVYDPVALTITFEQVEDITFNPGIFAGPYVFELQ